MKKTYLVVYDYGQGGVWFLLDARSVSEIQKKWPFFKAYKDRPEWMSPDEKLRYVERCKETEFQWDIDNDPEGWLAIAVSERTDT